MTMKTKLFICLGALLGVAATVQQMGSGQVVYFVDNPLFRCFWQQGKLLFANAVFYRD